MNKRKQAFLDKKTKLMKFTLSSLHSVYSFTEEEVKSLIENGFIELVIKPQCINCYTVFAVEPEFCQFCGSEDFTENESYYRYSDKSNI